MSTSAFFGAQVAMVSAPALFGGVRRSAPWSAGGGGVVVIECSSRPQKKATAHHKKTRPRKTQAWDIRRKPTVYSPLPPLPPDWLLSSDDSSSDATATATATAISNSSPESAPAT